MKLTHRLTAGALTLVMGVGMFSLPVAARASEEGRRNTALGLGAAAAALLLTQKNKLPGIIAGAGAAYAYKRYDDSVKDRHNREDYYYGRDGRYNDRYYNDRNYDSRYDSRYDRGSRNYTYDAGRYNDRSYNDSRYNDRYDRTSRDSRYYRSSRNSDDCPPSRRR